MAGGKATGTSKKTPKNQIATFLHVCENNLSSVLLPDLKQPEDTDLEALGRLRIVYRRENIRRRTEPSFDENRFLSERRDKKIPHCIPKRKENRVYYIK